MPIKYVIFKLLIFIPFWTERQEQNENSSHIHEKYSPHHPQIILPLSVAYTGTYQPFCVTLTIHPPPLPPQARKRCIQAFSLIIRFSIVFFASESRAGSRVTGLTCPAVWLYTRPRQIPYYAHQRFSVVLRLTGSGNFSKKNRVPVGTRPYREAYFSSSLSFLSSFLPLLLLLRKIKTKRRAINFSSGEKSFIRDKEDGVFVNWLERLKEG